jgi:hypothetical protein
VGLNSLKQFESPPEVRAARVQQLPLHAQQRRERLRALLGSTP